MRLALAQLLDYEPFLFKGKLIYIALNIPMPCPPRGTVPVNSGAWIRESVSPQHARFAFGQGCDCASYVGGNLTKIGHIYNAFALALSRSRKTPVLLADSTAPNGVLDQIVHSKSQAFRCSD